MSKPGAGKARRGRGRVRRGREVDTAILVAAEELLTDQPLADLTVADIMDAAGVSRGSFYFYFESKEAVVAALLERIVEEVHAASLPWFERGDTPPADALREAIAGSLSLWRRHAAVLRSAVESWQSDDDIRTLWTGVLERFTRAAAAQIASDREAGIAAPGPPPEALAGALIAMNERCFYFALLEGLHGPDEMLVDVLTSIWLSAVYGSSAGEAGTHGDLAS